MVCLLDRSGFEIGRNFCAAQPVYNRQGDVIGHKQKRNPAIQAMTQFLQLKRSYLIALWEVVLRSPRRGRSPGIAALSSQVKRVVKELELATQRTSAYRTLRSSCRLTRYAGSGSVAAPKDCSAR